MPSSGMSHSEARDLLHKLITESTNVQGIVVGNAKKNGFKAMVTGRVEASANGVILVIGGPKATSPFVAFDPALATSIRYGDDRVVLGREGLGADLFRREFSSGMTFLFEDGSSAAIFELKESE